MGVEVVDEHPYEFPGSEPFWIYDFGLRREGVATSGPGGRATQVPQVSLASVAGQLEGALSALWNGEIEDDEFNTLVLDAGLTWRQVVVLRAYAKYLQQVGTTFSSGYIARVLRSNPVIARQLIRLFESRFDPDRQAGQVERSEALVEEINGELDDVASLDEDRILRAYLGLVRATQRTNYFSGQPGSDERAPYLVFKLDDARVPDLPAPRPKFELFVYSPRFEGVHLRFANVARGGLRWSDRREDFRTEILGLAKAQEVKNSVIVPSGAKGGFVCKQLPDPADREAYQGEVLACYRMFISAMLDVTDNLKAGRVIPPGAGRQARRRRPVPGRRGRQGHGDVLRHGQRDRAEPRLLARRRVRLWRLGRLRPQEDGHHGARRVGVGQVPLPDPRRRHQPDATSRSSGSATCRATSSATGCCCPSASSWWRRSTTGTSSSTPTLIRRPASPSGSACSTCPGRRGMTTTRGSSPAAAASGRARRSRSRSRRRPAPCSGSRTERPRSRPTS